MCAVATFKSAIRHMLSPGRANNPFEMPLCIRAPETCKTNIMVNVRSPAYIREGAMAGAVVSGMANNPAASRADTGS